MKKLIAMLFIFAAITTSNLSSRASEPFRDIPSGHYCSEAILSMKEKGIVSGYPDGSYRPQNSVTRAEMASIICRMTEETSVGSNVSFPDVPHEHWARGYIAKAADENIITGDAKGYFRPDDPVTYEEAIKMSVMATGYANSVNPYPSDWSAVYLEIADKTEISKELKGAKGEMLTRADAALMMYNTLKVKENSNYVFFGNHIYNSGLNIPTNASFALDFNTFAKDNSSFDSEIAKASAVLSMTAYDSITLNGKAGNNSNRVLRILGFNTIETKEPGKESGDNNTSKIYLAKKTLKINEEEAELVAVVICGTDKGQWTSNFDIGDGKDNGEYDKLNHRGFDITAKRILKEIREYISKNTKENTQKILWITGHSRGGSLSDICGASLADKGEKCFVYTFGASRTTTSPRKGEYDFIFNIVNTDDIVSCIPLEKWGFGNYGKTAGISLSKELVNQWQKETGLKNYNFAQNIDELVKAFENFSPTRKDCYEYNSENEATTGVNDMESGENYAQAILKTFSQSSLPYISYEVKKSSDGSQYPYTVHFKMQPAFYMHNIAAAMEGRLGMAAIITMPLPKHLEGTFTSAMTAYSGGISHPHTPEAYLMITKNLTHESFK